ncbi:MAG: ABC transporter permease [Thermogemmatispora sp.]|uniref:FtsX-like permease family protein n=1 Tax=Thermogemmatispora sp. TaxID=1968838 RepID=UPI0026211B8A|nr:FtsX-like permease family protein [Thermogemmatispora sp.]MBX5455420.1 ABC transporter permease [Thermogemmatispora sp.]
MARFLPALRPAGPAPTVGNGGETASRSLVRLAFWRLRRTWGLLSLTALGLLAAVMIICTVPLYSALTLSLGLQEAFHSQPQSADILVQSSAEQLSVSGLSHASALLDQEFQRLLGSYLSTANLSIVTPPVPLLDTQTQIVSGSEVQLVAEPAASLATHASLLTGRFPQATLPAPTADILEIALSSQEASQLKARPGSTFTVQFAYVEIPTQRIVYNVTLRVVGIFSPHTDPSFWQGATFTASPRGVSDGQQLGLQSTFLTTTESLLALFDRFGQQTHGLVLEEPFTLSWLYRIDPQKASISDLHLLFANIDQVESEVVNNPGLNTPPLIEHLQVNLPSDALQEFYDQMNTATIPLFSLVTLVMALVLFFIAIMTDLLIDRQSEAVAILRSRGASRLQVAGMFFLQALLLAMLALVGGPLLAIALVLSLAHVSLPDSGQLTQQLLISQPVQTLFSLGGYALAATLVGLLTMAFTIGRATRSDVLALRREAARTSQAPLWQRLHLDVVAALLMLPGYGMAFYLTHSNVLDAHTRLILLAPLTLLGAVLLIIAGLLLLLRLLPLMLTAAAHLAAGRRGLAPLLALAQMARAPRQSLRMTLLLALATACLLFTQVLLASQVQRSDDSSAFQVGADFSGAFLQPHAPNELATLTAAYRRLPGVLSASLGHATTLSGGGTQNLSIALRAVDAETFTRTARWTRADSAVPLPTLMQALVAARKRAIVAHVIPAIVDVNAARSLQIQPDQTFTLNSSDGQISLAFQDVATVDAIPTIVSSSLPSGSSSDDIPAGGVLIDYRTYVSVLQSQLQQAFVAQAAPLNYAWLRTVDDGSQLAALRQQLSKGALALSPLLDRRSLRAGLLRAPLYLDLIGVLTIGATSALLLALFGSLTASWLSVRRRLTAFAVLRALGSSPGQLAATLAWEQLLIYVFALTLGIGLGALFSWLSVPTLVFTATSGNAPAAASSGAFYVAQSMPPVQLAIPAWLPTIPALLLGLFILALGMMMRTVSRPAVSYVLRVSED